MSQHKISEEKCREMIHGVCNSCGGELEPIETVDNSGDPTYWAGCRTCDQFCWGVDRKVYEIARALVEEKNYVAYAHMENPRDKDDEYKDYWFKSQVAGATHTVINVIEIMNRLNNASETPIIDLLTK